ncbi:MAG: hypothetical protein DSZ06_01185 [Sulfurospirillum sp.]|nr:MAG: hypothetical protein DSZ06_01185 [Sulfurospirillum sp.]
MWIKLKMDKLILTFLILLLNGCIFTPPPSTLNQESGTKEEYFGTTLLKVAKDQLGICYLYGGNSPNSGFDCSGFVQYVYKKSMGIKLPRRSIDQSNIGDFVSKSDLLSGDLLFFDTAKRGQINHVGIYIGDGKFIHASSGKKKHCVTISNLNKGFYKRTFRFAKRVY